MTDAVKCDRCGAYAETDVCKRFGIEDREVHNPVKINSIPTTHDLCPRCFNEYLDWWRDP